MFSSLLFKDIVIQQDDEIRLKIVGTRVDKNDIVSVFFCLFLLYISSHHRQRQENVCHYISIVYRGVVLYVDLQ